MKENEKEKERKERKEYYILLKNITILKIFYVQ